MKFKRVMVANRGEIAIRVFRACAELGIRTVAIYSEEDKCALFRSKADEAYMVGKGKNPVEAYLGIDEIINLAKKKGVDAIHPGYGFLSENPEFAQKCEEAGIVFIGPSAKSMMAVGDKIQSKILAKNLGIPCITGIERPIKDSEEAYEIARKCGYPVILKASAGGGGRGMRIVRGEKEIKDSFEMALSESLKNFASSEIFLEKYIESPKHIEVQLLGDESGNVVHLYERDCSIQRRHQKIIEIAPSLGISDKVKNRLYEDAIKIAKEVSYKSAGTVEFLVDKDGNHYFIEMNPRIQVEHTISEMITGIDIVQTQIMIAEGKKLSDPEIDLSDQNRIRKNGYAIQCRITTEDPLNDFIPDTGKLDVYMTGSGFGIRLDGGNGFAGSNINPYYDSLLVKSIAWSRSFEDARRKAVRNLKENRIEGVKTNSDFLINVLNHNEFKKGLCTTNFIEEYPEIMDFEPREDLERKVLEFLGNKIVNESKGTKPLFDVPIIPENSREIVSGSKQLLDKLGPEGFKDWVLNQKQLLLTDTTMRDAHQSLMATRMRTVDMVKIAPAMAKCANSLFSIEMWGGATFDVAYRFLKEDPWERLITLRKKIPNILFQMLIRGSNAVGYKNYPDNLNREFIKKSAENGIDVFRIFDSLNWLENMKVSIEEVQKQNKIAEACICYTGDILDKNKKKYDLKYYVNLAKEIEKTGAHILGIKDMAALLKPYAAYELISTLKKEIKIPIHLHTHDTSGNGVATLLMAAQAGVDIVDTAFNSMSGLTSQPALNSIVAALENTERETKFDLQELQQISDYYASVRTVYSEYESGLKSGTAEIYRYEIPGGQYSNLKPQVESFGLGHKFNEVKEKYKEVNYILGDIVKVTPSSKVVGDLAIFMVQNNLSKEDLLLKGNEIAFPDSVVDFYKGMIGIPEGGFDKELQKIVLKGDKPIDKRAGELLEDLNFDEIEKKLISFMKEKPTKMDILSYALYPKVFENYYKDKLKYGNLSRMGSDVFFHGLNENETSEIFIDKGKSFIVKYLKKDKVDSEGFRNLSFEVDGNRRDIKIKDKANNNNVEVKNVIFANQDIAEEIGSNIPGTVSKVLVNEGDIVLENTPLLVIEAMKMETQIKSKISGSVKNILVKEGELVKQQQLLIELKK